MLPASAFWLDRWPDAEEEEEAACACWEEEDEFGRTIGTSVALLFEPKVCTKKKATSVVNGGWKITRFRGRGRAS